MVIVATGITCIECLEHPDWDMEICAYILAHCLPPSISPEMAWSPAKEEKMKTFLRLPFQKQL